MGILFSFVCPACNHEVVSAGGTAARSGTVTKTIACKVCHDLMDVTVARRHERGWDQYPAACPTNHDHPVEPWLFEGPCPRCGTAMKADEACTHSI